METGKSQERNSDRNSNFDYTKIWYLIPFTRSDEIKGCKHEGRVIDYKSDFFKSEGVVTKSGIRITDSINICTELSEPFIFSVKLDDKSSVVPDDDNELFWYISSLQLLKPVFFSDLLPQHSDVFHGSISISYQQSIPKGLVFPKVIKGNLRIYGCALPSEITLPEVVEGNFEIAASVIPHAWKNKFPLEVGNLILRSTNISRGFILPGKVMGNVRLNQLTNFEKGIIMPESYESFEANWVRFPAGFKFNRNRLNHLFIKDFTMHENFELPKADFFDVNFKNNKIHSGIKFPVRFKGNLTFSNSILKKGLKLPEKLEGTLSILYGKIEAPLCLPLNPKCEIRMHKGSDIRNLVAPQTILDRIKYIEPVIQSFRLADSDFDHNKTWFLGPHDSADTFFESLNEGIILHDKSALKTPKRKKLKSKIKITDFNGICRELSESFIYPVKVVKDSRIGKADQNSWYASKVKLLKPQIIWDFLNSMFQDTHIGTINFSGQPILSNKLRLPDILQGDLIFKGTIFPGNLKLPRKIEGELKIQSCVIPETWRLPVEIKKISLIDCSFQENINLGNNCVSEISILNSRHKHQLLFPIDFSGTIELERETLSAEFKLPTTVKNLSLTEVRFEKGIIFPHIISGKLTLKNIHDFKNVKLPASCHSFLFSNSKLPRKILASLNNLEELEFFK